MVGGTDSTNVFSSIEVFPPSAACSIPPLPQPRGGHSLSPLSEGRLVICGGFNSMTLANHIITQTPLNSCIFWVAGNTNWALLYNMRWLKLKNSRITVHLLVGWEWDEIRNGWDGSHLLPSQTPTNHPSRFFWHIITSVPKRNEYKSWFCQFLGFWAKKWNFHLVLACFIWSPK